MHLKIVDPFAAKFAKLIEARNKEVAESIESGIDIEDEINYNNRSNQQELIA